jgi:ribosomal protein S18 acetylase RimI-like enzyme
MFYRVVDKNTSHFESVSSFFQTVIEPIYGNQTSALEKIGEGHDRLCEGMFSEDRQQLLGIIVYKKSLQGEEKTHLEVKTFALINADQQSRRGYGTALFNHLLLIAEYRNALAILLTVSEAKGDALTFFTKKGFTIIQTKPEGNCLGLVEHSLVYNMPPQQKIEKRIGSFSHAALFSTYLNVDINSSLQDKVEKSSEIPSEVKLHI